MRTLFGGAVTMILINVPIEPLEERYSKQWDEWFKEKFQETFTDVITVYGEETSGKINDGSFLDVVETNKYKTSQLLKILDILQTFRGYPGNIVFFFHDLWFPGIEQIAYIRDGLGMGNVLITGCMHAGTYDPHDFLTKSGMRIWGYHFERMLNTVVDTIFVATEFHKQLMEKGGFSCSKIEITGFPLYGESFVPKVKVSPIDLEADEEFIIVFPHRKDTEKQPHLMQALMDNLKSLPYNYKAVFTVDECKDKEEYYQALSRADFAVSFALQETWGIAMQEAVMCGCIPLVPDRLSYTEMYHKDFKYLDMEDLTSLVLQLTVNLEESRKLVDFQQTSFQISGESAIPNIISILKQYDTE